MRIYSTLDEAVQVEIIDVLTAADSTLNGKNVRDAYDIDAIAAETLGDYDDGYAEKVFADTFWEIVQKHTK